MKEKRILLDPLFLLAEKALLYPHELTRYLRLPEDTIYKPSSWLIIMKNIHTKKSLEWKKESFITEWNTIWKGRHLQLH